MAKTCSDAVEKPLRVEGWNISSTTGTDNFHWTYALDT